ncbi:hypothetical protein HanXRQr2_Chr10g0425361 [Helianthus annuus]|uniref:Uncharacterized protein n=1 Tax=Helianthus annuus TaxID=4232 RepID=A0A9K3N3D5_HELAN|nr:hypothetical protein HanXRQr2_Chr10g0425361 [Helianthus annuus]
MFISVLPNKLHISYIAWLDKMPFDFLFILLFILSYLLASIPDYHRSLRKCSVYGYSICTIAI